MNLFGTITKWGEDDYSIEYIDAPDEIQKAVMTILSEYCTCSVRGSLDSLIEEVGTEQEIKVKSFTCEDNLSKYVDSMLFDSEEEIANGIFSYNGELLEISLRVCGEVNVTYKGETYRKPSEFPEELKQRIREHPYAWEYTPSGEENDKPEADIYVEFNNWFEYIFTYDGHPFEGELSEATPDTILNDMLCIARRYFRS